jgi:hypothetical protein
MRRLKWRLSRLKFILRGSLLFLSLYHKGNEININRTAMVTPESSSVLLVTVKCVIPCKGKITFRPSIIY